MPRPNPFSTLTPDAKRVYEKITAKRGQMRGGPFASLMHHPALAEKVGDLGEFLRFGSTLPDDVIERIRTRGDLATLPPRYARPAQVVQHVLGYESIPQGLQDEVKGELGMTGLMELVIAGVLFAFDSPLPEGTPPPF